MKLYAVVWGCGKADGWHCNNVYTDEAIAEARLTLDQLEHPTWAHRIIEGDVPDIDHAHIQKA